jgi:hypothetical protein
MSHADDILAELKALYNEGGTLMAEGGKRKKHINIRTAYESWYTRALSAIRQLVPEREGDFRDAYRKNKRKQIDAETYAIDDYLHGIAPTRHSLYSFGEESAFDTEQVFKSRFLLQIGILNGAMDLAPSKLRDLRSVLQAEILDGDVLAAAELLKAGHLRSAGVVCGVAIEAHLKSVATRRNISIPKKKATLGDLNDLMRAAGVYDVPMWRFVQRLADIRNLCGHKGDREPTRDELNDQILGTDKVLKEVA